MAGLYEFEFLRGGGPKPGDALLLRAAPASRSWPGPAVRIYGFSDGRVLEVSSEDDHFDDWENQYLTSAPAGTDDKVFLEAAGAARDRARIVEVAASLDIPAEDASRFFDQVKQREASFNQKAAELQNNQAASPGITQDQMRAAVKAEITKLALQPLGDKGPALVDRIFAGK